MADKGSPFDVCVCRGVVSGYKTNSLIVEHNV